MQWTRPRKHIDHEVSTIRDARSEGGYNGPTLRSNPRWTRVLRVQSSVCTPLDHAPEGTTTLADPLKLGYTYP